MKTKNIFISLALSCVMLLSASCENSKKEYIEGNVLHLPVTALNAKKNALLSPWSYSGIQAGLMFRTLFLADSSLTNFKPDLAKLPEVLNDGKSYKITLLDGQKWSDGTLISPQDVAFSIQSILLSKDININPVLTTSLSKISNIDIEGNELTIHLFESYYNFIPALAQLAIMPKHILENEDMSQFHLSDFWINPIVSGMYELTEIVKDNHFILHKNKNYSGTMPKIDEVRLHMNYKSAPLDYYYTNNIAEMMHYRSNRAFAEYPVSMRFIRYFVFNMQGIDGYTNPDMQDKRLREAICYAIDNVGLVSKIYFQVGSTFNNATKNAEGFYDYNPQRAKEILAKIDYDFSKPITLAYYYTDNTSKDVMNFLKSNLEDVGFTVELMQAGENFETLYTERAYDILFKGLASFNELEWYFEYDSKHPFLPMIIDNYNTFTPLLSKASTEVDKDEQAILMQNLDSLEKEMLYKFPIYSPVQVAYLQTERVKLPKNINFGNPWYICDVDFANWEILKK